MKQLKLVIFLLLVFSVLKSFAQSETRIFDRLDSISAALTETLDGRLSFNESDSIRVNSLVDSILVEYKNYEGLDSLIKAVEHFRLSYNVVHKQYKFSATKPDTLEILFKGVSRYLRQYDTISYTLEVIDTIQLFRQQDLTARDKINLLGYHSPEYTYATYASADPSLYFMDDLLSEKYVAGWGCCRVKIRVRIKVKNPIPAKPLDALSGALKDVTRAVADVIPENVKVEATKVLGNTAIIASDAITIVRENGKVISKITKSGYEMYKTISDAAEQNVVFLKDGLLAATGVTLPTEIDNALNSFITNHDIALKELYKLYSASVDLQDKGLEMTSVLLKEFGKYLLLSSNGFPKELKGIHLSKSNGVASIDLNPDILNIFIVRAFEENLKISNKDAVTLVSFSSGTIHYDESKKAIRIELTDSKIRQNVDLGMPRISGTLNVKKIKLQVILGKDAEGRLTLTPNLYYLDVEDLMPKFDEMLCYVLQDKFLNDKTVTVDVKELLTTRFKMQGSSIDSMVISGSHLQPNFFFSDSSFGLTLSGAVNQPIARTTTDALEVSLTPYFLQSSLSESLAKTNGVKFNFKTEDEFDESRSHYYVRSIKDIMFQDDGSMIVSSNVSAHFRRFLGKQPKVNLIFDNVDFKIIPKLETLYDTTIIMKITAVPVVSTISLKDAPVRTKLLRKGLRLFKKASVPIELDPIDLSGITRVKIDNPINPTQNLITGKPRLSFLKTKDVWTFSIRIE